MSLETETEKRGRGNTKTQLGFPRWGIDVRAPAGVTGSFPGHLCVSWKRTQKPISPGTSSYDVT